MVATLPLFLFMMTWVLLSVALGLKFYEWWRKRELSAMLRTAAADPSAGPTKLLRDLATGRRAQLDVWLERLAILEKLEALIRQAGLEWTPGGVLLLAAAGIVAGVILSMLLPAAYWPWTAVVLPAMLGWLPFVYLRRKRNKRLAAFEEQFADALDFMARSMRAGHAFTISLKMVSEDLPEPLGLEFRTLFNEQNLGAPLEVALFNLTARVPLLDVRFFSSAVMLQKQTGGNLGEILTRLAFVIRERFRLRGQVKAASAHGRTTAAVLSVLPVATTILMLLVSPGYLQTLVVDKDGRWLIVGAIAGQLVGQWTIRRIIRIKV